MHRIYILVTYLTDIHWILRASSYILITGYWHYVYASWTAPCNRRPRNYWKGTQARVLIRNVSKIIGRNGKRLLEACIDFRPLIRRERIYRAADTEGIWLRCRSRGRVRWYRDKWRRRRNPQCFSFAKSSYATITFHTNEPSEKFGSFSSESNKQLEGKRQGENVNLMLNIMRHVAGSLYLMQYYYDYGMYVLTMDRITGVIA